MSNENHTKVRIVNKTDRYIYFRCLYKYSSVGENDSGWFILKPGGENIVFPDIKYWTGAFTSGHNLWKVQGIKLKEVNNANDIAFNYDGKLLTMDAIHMINEGYWLTHELYYEDAGKEVVIDVNFPNAEIRSHWATTSKLFEEYK